jgi:glycine cleavage system H protein
VLEVNEELNAAPEKINQEPYGSGWILRIRLANRDEAKSLMSAQEYDAFAKSD